MFKKDKPRTEDATDTRQIEKVPFSFYLQWPIMQLGNTVGNLVGGYKKMFKMAPTDLKAMYLKKSHALDRQGDAQGCVDFMEKYVSIDLKDPDAFYQLGVAYEKNKSIDAALGAYQRVLKINPDHAKAHYRKGILLLRKRDYEKAIKALEEALKHKPDSAELHFRLGQVSDRLKHYDKAISFFNKAVEIDPDFLQAYKNMALTYDSMNKHKEALECLKRALEIEEITS